MLIARSFWRKVLATAAAAAAFVFVYETTIRDSRYAARQESFAGAGPAGPGTQFPFTATAYCKGETTASGAGVRTGVAAADPSVLPVGTVVRLATHNARYDGIWTVMDTGPAVQGRTVDLYMWSCHEALAFGRRPIRLTILRLGWNPRNSTPSLVEQLFRRREEERRAAPPAPARADEPLPAPDVPVPVAPGS